MSGRSASRNGIPFTANLPTEEVFTIAHKDRVDGTVRASKPLSYGSTLIDGFSVTFERGRIVKMTADRNADTLQRLLDTDDGARRLGEVALVPHSSPISQSGLLYYNTLFDENAASHVALGNAYKFTLKGGNEMSDEEFEHPAGETSRPEGIESTARLNGWGGSGKQTNSDRFGFESRPGGLQLQCRLIVSRPSPDRG